MRRSLLRLCVLCLFCALISAGCASSENSDQFQAKDAKSTPTATTAIIHILPREGLFSPFIVAIQPGTLVTWQNEDITTHNFSTTPQQSAFLNPTSFSLSASAGTSVSVKPTHPGLYHYYETAEGSWNRTFQRVAANKDAIHFPLAMEGIIWVQGSVGQLPQAVLNSVLQNHDLFDKEFVAVKVGGSVTWHNFDADPHFLGIVAGWSPPINPKNFGLYRIAGTADVPGGQGVTVVFSNPGLYYYYCRNHDIINPNTTRVEAVSKASDYPIPMEGFVLVTSSSPSSD